MYLGDIGLGFLEGVAIISSPCIYPILPLLLATTTTGGHYRPFAIMVGFFINFTLFVFVARYLVNYFGIMPDIIKNTSLFFLVFFGATLLSNKMSHAFARATNRLSNWGAKILIRTEQKNHETIAGDIVAGLVIGATIALVWTPCAGPILASVLTQIIRQTDNPAAIILVLVFAMGVTLPFLVISLIGRRALRIMHWLPQNNSWMRKILGTIIITSSLFIAAGAYPADLPSFSPNNIFNKNFALPAPTIQLAALNQNGIEVGDFGSNVPFAPPPFIGIQQWLNVDAPLTLELLKGKVVLINFWVFSCYNCVNTLPSVVSWDKKYRSKGLVIIGVHSPEFESDKSVRNIEAALAKHGITYPVPVDNQLQTWDAYNNNCWPAFYFINKKGRVVKAICGEHDYSASERYIQKLLAE